MITCGLLTAVFIGLCGLGALISLLAVERRIPLLLAWTGSLASLVAMLIGAEGLFNKAWHLSRLVLPRLSTLGLGIDRTSGLFVFISGVVSLAASVFSTLATCSIIEAATVLGPLGSNITS